VVDGTFLAKHGWSTFVASNIVGLVCTLAFVARGWLAPSTIDRAYVAPTVGRAKSVAAAVTVPAEHRGSGHGVLYDVYVGFSFNPRVGPIDVKMFLYLYGALLIQVITASIVYTAAMAPGGGAISVALRTSAGLLTYFVLEYNYHEVRPRRSTYLCTTQRKKRPRPRTATAAHTYRPTGTLVRCG
jgi:hypothetical protein